jgi:hypothetical protein
MNGEAVPVALERLVELALRQRVADLWPVDPETSRCQPGVAAIGGGQALTMARLSGSS